MLQSGLVMPDDASMRRAFRVTVHYREPTYELFHGRRGEPYRWTFEVEAESPERAEREARRQFDELARVSNVGWVRTIVGIETEPAAGCTLRSA